MEYDPVVSLVGARRYIDNRVQSPGNELLGHVKDVALHVTNGHVAYVIVSAGGFLGFGERLYAVPWQRLKPAYGDRVLVCDLERTALERCRFDRHHWPSADVGSAAEAHR